MFDCSIMEKLLQRARHLVDIKKDDGFAAIHLSSLNGYKAVTKILIIKGHSDINLRNGRDQTPLHLAASQVRPRVSRNVRNSRGFTISVCPCRNVTVSSNCWLNLVPMWTPKTKMETRLFTWRWITKSRTFLLWISTLMKLQAFTA